MKRDFDPAPAGSSKHETRREMRQRLEAMSPALRAEASLVICELAAQWPAFRNANCVGLFAPLPTEPDIHPLIEEAWAEKKTVVLPRLWKDGDAPQLAWHAVTTWSEITEPGPFGLREPDPKLCPRVDPARLDGVFIPGMAFDQTGLRLGRGGGYYDRFLGTLATSVARCGLMFSLQRKRDLPREPHDQALPTVITEDGFISFVDASSGAGARSIQPPPSTSSPT